MLNQFTRYAKARHELQIELETEQIEAAKEDLRNSRKRRSTRLEGNTQKKSKPLFQAKDTLPCPGRTGTLGSNIYDLGSAIKITDNESAYYAYLSMNGIVDISAYDTNSQLGILRIKRNSKLATALQTNVDEHRTNICNIVDLTTIRNSMTRNTCYNKVEVFIPCNGYDRAIKKILLHILDQHAHSDWMLAKSYLDKCSEQSIIIKYWGPLVEAYFGRDTETFIQWGDTVSQHQPEMSNTFRLDLRILVKANNGKDLEAATGEFASKTTTMASKLFKDKLKSILVTKHHFNELVYATKHVDTKALKTVRIPILQIMGTSCFLYSFGLVDKTIYTVQDVDECVYPATMMQVKNGAIEDLLQLFAKTDTMLKDLKSFHADYSQDTSNQIAKIKSKKGQVRLLDTDNWLSPMVYPGDDDACSDDEVDETREE